MQYIVDAYNLIFTALDIPLNLRGKREAVIESLSLLLAEVPISILLVFDGSRSADEETGYQYHKHFDAFFSPKGQSADDYIIEYISISKRPKKITVVSSDRSLCQQSQSLGAFCLSPKNFLAFLEKKRQKKTIKESRKQERETDANIERLKKIFEKRLKT